MPRGTLFLVVGPSGAGKDSLIDAARAALAADSGFVFPRRAITRPADAGGEDHVPVSEAEFEETRQGGGFALHWDAHGFRYGVPRAAAEHLAAGRSVVVNVSRSVIDEARTRLSPVTVVSVMVSGPVLRERLRARARESEAGIAKRLARADAYRVTGPDVVEIHNDGTLDTAVGEFLSVLRAAAPAT